MKTGRLRLTDHELQVLSLMAQGVAVKAIGTQLGIATKAVSAARQRALRRNGVTNYLQLGMLLERCQSLPVETRNRSQDRIEERLDLRRNACLDTGAR